MLKNNLNDYPVRIEDKYTFFGVLNEYYDTIFHRCNDKTRDNYNRCYNRHIIPPLAELTLEECDLDTFEAVIENVKEAGFKPATIQQYRYLIRTVVKCAVEHGICQDVLFGSVFSISPGETTSNSYRKEFVRNRKSLKVDEETRLFSQLMTNPLQDGTRIGLALMFALGLRNGEACGMKFSAIKQMAHYPGYYCAWVYETTIGETNLLKTGGKTKNAPRILPIPPMLVKLLMQRRDFLQGEIEAGNIVLSPESGLNSVDDLPIACQTSHFTVHCASRHLTASGRLLLREIQVNEDEVAYIDRELQDPQNMIEMGVTEKDPTAYLLRRNLGTHLYLLGFTESEIQYFMGHDMEDVYADRNEFTNEEHLFTMLQKLQNRPLFNYAYPHEEILTLTSEHPSIRINNMHTVAIALQPPPSSAMARLQVTAREPKDQVSICAECDYPIKAGISITASPHTEVSRTVNVIQQYQQAYKNSHKKKL